MKRIGINWKGLNLKQTIGMLKDVAEENKLQWKEELDADFSNEVEFLLGSRGWWLLCHIGKDYPYTIRYRLIGGEKNYSKIKPKDFVKVAKQMLLH